MTGKKIGPFVGVSLDEIKTYPNGRSLRFISYEAYDAFGLIGSENNGVAILDEDNKSVVCDSLGISRGMGGREPKRFSGLSQSDVFQEIVNMDWDEISDLVRSSPRARVALDLPKVAVQPLGADQIPDVFFSDVVQNKAEFAHRSQEFLGHLARALKLKEGEYDIRYNAGGPAVSGDATLHSDKAYIQVQQSFSDTSAQILYRRCQSRNDFVGSHNRFIMAGRLSEMSTSDVASEISACLGLLVKKTPGLGI